VRSLRRALSNGQVLLGCGIVGLFFAVAILAPLLAPPDDPGDPSAFRAVGKSRGGMPQPPSQEALLGTTVVSYRCVIHLRRLTCCA